MIALDQHLTEHKKILRNNGWKFVRQTAAGCIQRKISKN